MGDARVCIRLASSCRLQSGDIIKIPRYLLGTGAWECLRRDEKPGARRRHGGNGELGQGLNFYLSPRIISDKYEA